MPSKTGTPSTPKPWTPFVSHNQRCWLVGYNPGIRSFETQSFYAHPTNRFWKLLFESGLVPELIEPQNYRIVQTYDIVMIDLSMRPTVSGSELTKSEMEQGRLRILMLVRELQPKWLAANGLGIARVLMNNDSLKEYGDAGTFAGTATRLWVLPSSSGRAGSRNGAGITYEDKLKEWKKLQRVLSKG